MLAPSPSKGTEVFVSGTLILVTELHSSGLTDAKAVTVILIKTSEKENIHLETEAAALDNGVAWHFHIQDVLSIAYKNFAKLQPLRQKFSMIGYCYRMVTSHSH